MLLVQRGKVKLDEPASRYLPEFTGGERGKILVRDLLRHSWDCRICYPRISTCGAHVPLSEFVRHT